MALSNYSSVETGSVYGYDSFGTVYGVKVIKEVYISEITEYRYIAQHGKTSNNKFEVYSGGKDLSLFSEKELKSHYESKWTEDAEYKKGDILAGKDSSGNRVVLLFEDKDTVHRLTSMAFSGLDVSYGTLGYYQGKLKELHVVKTANSSKRFSDV